MAKYKAVRQHYEGKQLHISTTLREMDRSSDEYYRLLEKQAMSYVNSLQTEIRNSGAKVGPKQMQGALKEFDAYVDEVTSALNVKLSKDERRMQNFRDVNLSSVLKTSLLKDSATTKYTDTYKRAVAYVMYWMDKTVHATNMSINEANQSIEDYYTNESLRDMYTMSNVSLGSVDEDRLKGKGYVVDVYRASDVMELVKAKLPSITAWTGVDTFENSKNFSSKQRSELEDAVKSMREGNIKTFRDAYKLSGGLNVKTLTEVSKLIKNANSFDQMKPLAFALKFLNPAQIMRAWDKTYDRSLVEGFETSNFYKYEDGTFGGAEGTYKAFLDEVTKILKQRVQNKNKALSEFLKLLSKQNGTIRQNGQEALFNELNKVLNEDDFDIFNGLKLNSLNKLNSLDYTALYSSIGQ